MPTPNRSKVLAVDDMPANLIALEAVLSGEYELVTAGSGAEAIQIMSERDDIDLILMDLQMPGMDGFQAAEVIKTLPQGRDVPIIFITAIYKEEPFVKRGYQVGAVDYFSKPFDPDILKMKIEVYTSFRRKAAVLRDREAQLRESEELLQTGRRLSSLLEGLRVGVLIADVQGRICQTNEAVARILHTDEAARNDAYGLILGWWGTDGQLIKNHGGPLHRALHEGTESHNEVVEIRDVDGAEKMILVSASPLRADDQHIVGAVVVLQDVTEPKRVEKDLESRISKLVAIGIGLGHDAGL